MFKLIPNTVDFYISESGVIRTPNRVVSIFKDQRGYLRANLVYENKWKVKTVHFLVAITFLGFPPGKIGKEANDYQVNHIDCNKENNHYSNLEWITCRENIQHATINNLYKDNLKGEKHHNSKLTEKQVYEIRVRAANGEKCVSIAESLNINKTHTRNIITGKWWTSAPGPITKDHVNGFLFKITNPAGEEYITTNLTGFCKLNNLDHGNMFAVADGKVTSHKGWKVLKFKDGKLITPKVNLVNKFNFRIISSDNIEIVTSNLKEFCKQHSELSYKTLTNKTWESKDYKGWKFYREEFTY